MARNRQAASVLLTDEDRDLRSRYCRHGFLSPPPLSLSVLSLYVCLCVCVGGGG